MADLNPGKQAPITVKTRREGDTPVVSLSGELDLSNTERVRSQVDDALAGGSDRLVFELSGLEFMDSSGIALLAAAAQRGARDDRPSNIAALTSGGGRP